MFTSFYVILKPRVKLDPLHRCSVRSPFWYGRRSKKQENFAEPLPVEAHLLGHPHVPNGHGVEVVEVDHVVAAEQHVVLPEVPLQKAGGADVQERVDVVHDQRETARRAGDNKIARDPVELARIAQMKKMV